MNRSNLSPIAIGTVLKNLRYNFKFSKQLFVAKKIGCCVSDLSKLENGKKHLTLEELEIFCNFYNITLHNFIALYEIKIKILSIKDTAENQKD